MRLHDLTPDAGAKQARRRVGRGTGGRRGKTAGRGMKGQHARTQVHPGFEGGQLPLMQRIPKLRGFKNPFRVAYTPVNLDALAALGTSTVSLEAMAEAGLIRKGALVKVLGRGEVTRALSVSAHAFSATAESAITSAGGSVERVPLPFGHGRPPASGNALMNR
jgi:large subunit ribosomal protein L15